MTYIMAIIYNIIMYMLQYRKRFLYWGINVCLLVLRSLHKMDTTTFFLLPYYSLRVCTCVCIHIPISLPTHSQDGGTALYMASQNGHTSTVDVLLGNGADPNIVTRVSALCLLTLLMTRFVLELE